MYFLGYWLLQASGFKIITNNGKIGHMSSQIVHFNIFIQEINMYSEQFMMLMFLLGVLSLQNSAIIAKLLKLSIVRKV